MDARPGEILKQGRLTGAVETYYASPIAAGDHVYLMSQGGKMTVVKAGASWDFAALNDFEDEAYATPAVAGNAITCALEKRSIASGNSVRTTSAGEGASPVPK